MQEYKVIHRRRLYQDIVRQIQDMIREGVLKPGARLPAERELAERMEVSRSTLREAVRTLELQGLVESRPGAGTFVRHESPDALVSIMDSSFDRVRESLQDISEVRHLLEPQIAALAAERATEADIQHMEEAINNQEAQIARGETGVDGDTAFHFAMAQATQNWALLIVMSNVSDVLRQSRDLSLHTPGRPQRSLASHRHVLEMVGLRDKEGARAAMEHHLSEVEPGQVPLVAKEATSSRGLAGDASWESKFKELLGISD